jgi:hypothetical protein
MSHMHGPKRKNQIEGAQLRILASGCRPGLADRESRAKRVLLVSQSSAVGSVRNRRSDDRVLTARWLKLYSIGAVSPRLGLWTVRRNFPVPHHAGSVPQQSEHRTPTVFADRFEQRLLCLAPLRLGILDKFAALVRD